MVTQLGVIVVNFADTMMVSAYGTDQLAAAAFVNSIFMVAMVMQMGFANGVTPLVGALYSRGDHDGVGAMMRAGIRINAFVSLAFTAVLGVLYFFLDHFGQDPEILPIARPYYLLMLASLLPSAIFNVLQQVSSGCTNTAMPMWLVISANILNIAGNYALIFGHWGMPELGLTGAGISTLSARIFGTVAIVAVYMFSRSRAKYRHGWHKTDNIAADCRTMWLTSYPIMIQMGIESFMWTFGAVVSGWFGKIQLAAYQVVNTIAQLGFMIYLGFSVAVSIRVANYAGLNNYDGMRRITKAGLHLSTLLAILSSLAFYLFFKPLLGIFTDDAAVIATALPLLLPLILYQLGDAAQLNYACAQRGTSVVNPLLWVSAISYILIGVPTLLLLAVYFDLECVGVYYSFSAALFSAAILYFLSFRRTTKKA